jgi:hypothetical protein
MTYRYENPATVVENLLQFLAVFIYRCNISSYDSLGGGCNCSDMPSLFLDTQALFDV